MRKILTTFITCTILLFSNYSLAANKNVQPLDRMVAVVNDDVITTSELTQAMHIAKSQLASQGISLPAESAFKKQVLDQLILKKIQLQMAKKAGVDVSRKELDTAISRVAKENHLSTDELYSKLKQTGLSKKEYRGELHEQLLVQKLQQREVASKITITSEEVTSFMNSRVWQNNSEKEYRLDDILVPVADEPTPDDIAKAKDRAHAILTKLKAGEPFKSIAQSESGHKNALQGGDLGWRQLPEIPSAFTSEVSHMRKADVTGPIQTPNGFHIIKLTDVRSANDKPKLTKDAIKNLLLQQKFEEAMLNWVSRVRSQAFVDIQPEKAWS